MQFGHLANYREPRSFLVRKVRDRRLRRTNKSSKSPGLPYAGVPHKLPPRCSWLLFHEWSKVYGPIYKFKIMGEEIVAISDRTILDELLVKRRSNYSSRPDFPAIPGANYDMRYLPLLASGGMRIHYCAS